MSHLRRSLGLPVLLFYGVGVIVGAGIYSIIGAVAGAAGSGAWLSLLLAAVPALLVGLCYAELSTMLPRAGASYVYVREALPRIPWAAFLTGYVFVVSAAATAATVAAAFGGHVRYFLDVPPWACALGLLALCTLVNIAGIRQATWFTILCTLIELAGLLVIITLGLRTERLGEGALTFEIPSVLTGAAVSFFVYTGFEGLANLSEEAKTPRRDIPLAILISLAVTTGLYVLVALAVLALATPQELAGSDAPLVTAASNARPWMKTALGWVALFSTANTALITLVTTSRTVMAMGQEGELPAALGRTSEARQSPWPAALAMGAIAALFLPLGEVAVLGSVSSLLILVLFVAVCVALLVLRRSRGDLRASFRIPGTIGRVAVVPAAAIVAVVLLAARFDLFVYAAGAGALAVGALLYATRRWWGRAGTAERRAA